MHHWVNHFALLWNNFPFLPYRNPPDSADDQSGRGLPSSGRRHQERLPQRLHSEDGESGKNKSLKEKNQLLQCVMKSCDDVLFVRPGSWVRPSGSPCPTFSLWRTTATCWNWTRTRISSCFQPLSRCSTFQTASLKMRSSRNSKMGWTFTGPRRVSVRPSPDSTSKELCEKNVRSA